MPIWYQYEVNITKEMINRGTGKYSIDSEFVRLDIMDNLRPSVSIVSID